MCCCVLFGGCVWVGHGRWTDGGGAGKVFFSFKASFVLTGYSRMEYGTHVWYALGAREDPLLRSTVCMASCGLRALLS